jgi:hypothetical protein
MSAWYVLADDYGELDEYLESKGWGNYPEQIVLFEPEGFDAEIFSDDGHPRHDEMMELHEDVAYGYLIRYTNDNNDTKFTIDTNKDVLIINSGQLDDTIVARIEECLKPLRDFTNKLKEMGQYNLRYDGENSHPSPDDDETDAS